MQRFPGGGPLPSCDDARRDIPDVAMKKQITLCQSTFTML